LERLRNLDLLNPADPLQKEDLDAHPLVRAYFGRRFLDRFPDSWRTAHERLLEYYEAASVPKPKDARELELILRAMSHACKAGKVEYAYTHFLSKCVRPATNTTGERLADHAALVSTFANFFDDLWSKPSGQLDEKKQRSLLGAASFSLKASGHQRRALEPIEVLLQRLEADKTRDHAKLAIVARRACEIKMNLGLLSEAEELARNAMHFADKTERRELRLAMRATLGDVLHQLGRFPEAQVQFNSANQVFSHGKGTLRFIEAEPGYKLAEYLYTCSKTDHLARLAAQFSEQAARPKTPGIFKGYTHFVNALALLGTDLENAKLAYYDVESALDYFERAGATEYVARCLRFGSRVLRATGDYDGAARDLSEAEYLATTYEFKLIVADCLIERAELHVAKHNPRDARDVLSRAISVAESMSYLKRKGQITKLQQQLT
jgi:tetratricopeptide (TPR) repeat protein